MNNSLIVNEGITLMLTGMFTVFMFLGLLIVLIYISSILFNETLSQTKQDNKESGKLISSDHKKIINHINKRIS
ncbi:MAG: Na+-transporting methylmalonyl-CoA/oxaloacetate decarboxylase gamma subunit [Gammaproteobacteria bacterium]|jgi:Na+-transporting methylmalonyl-CoA/oxaloacetate decarboxylase gamma subunit